MCIQGLLNVSFLGILSITFKYLLEILSPIVGWCETLGHLPTPDCFLRFHFAPWSWPPPGAGTRKVRHTLQELHNGQDIVWCPGMWINVYWGVHRWVTPKSYSLMGFSMIKHPLWGSPIYGNKRTNAPCLWHIYLYWPLGLHRSQVGKSCGQNNDHHFGAINHSQMGGLLLL